MQSNPLRKKFTQWQSVSNFNLNNDTWTAPSDGFLRINYSLAGSSGVYIYVWDVVTQVYIATISIAAGSGGFTYITTVPVYEGQQLRLVTNQTSNVGAYFMPVGS